MAHRTSALFLDRDSIDQDDLDFSRIARATDLKLLHHCRAEDVARQATGRGIVIVNKVRLEQEVISQMTDTRLICVIATGTNNVDIDAASRHGIRVCNVRDYAAASVSQHVFMLILALYTRFLDYQEDIRAGAWQAQSQFCLLTHPMRELSGKTLGLVGYGHIARAVEKIALAFGLRVLIANSLERPNDHQAGRLPLAQVLAQADILSLHCPLSELSRNLIGRAEFELMKKTAIIINTARGGIIHEGDLLEALETGLIGGAGIDCLVTEPPLADDPMIQARLPNLILTPHNAWATIEARQRLVDGTAANIEAYIEGVLDQPGQPASLNP